MEKTTYSDFTLYRKLLQQARPYWLHLAALFLLSLLSIPLALLTPLPLKIAVDSVIGSHPLPGFLERLLPAVAARSQTALLILAALLAVVIALLDQLQRLGSSLLSTYTGEKLVLSFRAQIFRHVQWLSLTYHDSKGPSDSTYRIQYDAPSIQWVLIDGIMPFMAASLTLAGMISVTARIDVQLSLVALAILPFLYLVFRSYAPHLRSHWHEANERQSSAMSVVQEALTAVRVVKAFGQEDHEHDRFIRHATEGMRARIRFSFADGVFGFLVGLTMAVGMAVVLIIGVRNVLAGRLTLGQLLIVMAYLLQLYDRLEALTRMAGDLEGSIACAERAFFLLDKIPDVTERPNARPISRATGAVAFRNVRFGYDADRPVLRDISFEIAPEACVAIVGTTGAGKTTLISLLTRFYDPTSGQIMLDGIDLRDYKLADLRNQFAIVPQEPMLFSTSIAENIAYARSGASYRDVVAAAQAANAHEFIVRLSQGYDTHIGDRGAKLSGGERQRISIARAFLKEAPILILDEPTSSVDIRTEALIMEAMERLMTDRTTFIITHRMSMLKNCDIRLEIESGRLVEAASVAVGDAT